MVANGTGSPPTGAGRTTDRLAMSDAGVFAVGFASGPAATVDAAVLGCLPGGLLILARRRWLWAVATRTAQLLLGACPIHLIVAHRENRSAEETPDRKR